MLLLQFYLLIGLSITLYVIMITKSPHLPSEPWLAGCIFAVVLWPVFTIPALVSWTRDVPIEWCIDYFKLKLG